jgi:N-acyl-D-amino-acid deacylase
MKLARSIFIFFLLCYLSNVGLISFCSDQYDILIKNVNIIDGTGKAAVKGHIAIKGDKIAAMGKVKAEASIVLDGSGLIACPGFIDPHNHTDFTITKFPLAENYVMQGVTTVTTGHCGLSTAPTKEMTFGNWLTKVEETGISINIAPLIGHGAVRGLVMGNDWRRKANRAEIEAMKGYVAEAMRSGAFGFSSGLDYTPTQFADKEELVELTKVAGKYGGFYDPHTRGIHSQWPTSDPEAVSYGLFYGKPEEAFTGNYMGYVEAVDIAREANIQLHIGHMSNCFLIPQPHPNSDALEYEAGKATVREIVEK